MGETNCRVDSTKIHPTCPREPLPIRWVDIREIPDFRLLKNVKHSEVFGTFARLRFKHLGGSGSSRSGSVRDRSVTHMLLTIVAIFLCCNSLAFCNNIYEIVRDARAHIVQNSTQPAVSIKVEDKTEMVERNQDVFDFSVELSNILISLNSASSIFVYLVFSSKYRSIIKSWFILKERKTTNDIAITTAMVAERALELSFIPDEASERLMKPESETGTATTSNTLDVKGELRRPLVIVRPREDDRSNEFSGNDHRKDFRRK
ncbi:hypothetical protein KIN20_001563 [Parelaphostrongylus tenuis]|uniref:Uncharacterized protein n=1 Tax=Parelaphostrongylus tenuis TaxID=148309 RepID=A0AAD5QG96_PARTN|nr:hypothetical protein KIN20_001563 [Parelaphostrongylus tenuis]